MTRSKCSKSEQPHRPLFGAAVGRRCRRQACLQATPPGPAMKRWSAHPPRTVPALTDDGSDEDARTSEMDTRKIRRGPKRKWSGVKSNAAAQGGCVAFEKEEGMKPFGRRGHRPLHFLYAEHRLPVRPSGRVRRSSM